MILAGFMDSLANVSPLYMGVRAAANHTLTAACMAQQEQRANFALWAVMKSPLMVGTDLRSLSQTALDILTAPEVLAINQDPLGAAGDLVFKEGPIEVSAEAIAQHGGAPCLHAQAAVVALCSKSYCACPAVRGLALLFAGVCWPTGGWCEGGSAVQPTC